MSKELDEAWVTVYHYNEEFIHNMGSEYIENPLKKELNTINNALIELKAIKEAKPSKALKCLEKIHFFINGSRIDGDKYKQKLQELQTIERTLLKVQEQDRVLEIIFKKQVDINEIKILLVNLKHCDDVERCKRYNITRKVGYKLKQEEFDLLKTYCNKIENRSE